MAAKFGVKLVMYGENQAEYGNDPNENYKPTMDRKFFSIGDPQDMVLGGKSVRDIMAETEFTLNDFAPYIPPSADFLEQRGVEEQAGSDGDHGSDAVRQQRRWRDPDVYPRRAGARTCGCRNHLWQRRLQQEPPVGRGRLECA